MCVAKAKAMISCAVTFRAADLSLCFHICKIRFSHDAAQLINKTIYLFIDCGY